MFKLINDGSITFAKENKAMICNKGSISALGILKLKDILSVDGLKANLISIIQISEDKCLVKFSEKNALFMIALEGLWLRELD